MLNYEDSHPKGWNRLREQLEREAREVLASQEPEAALNLSRYRHVVTAPVLRKLAYDSSLSGRILPIVFEDDSRTPGFPLGVIASYPGKELPTTERTLRVSLMSGRHPEMSFLCRWYICRNEEMAAVDEMAQEEEVSCTKALDFLSGDYPSGGLTLEVYHTGLEPMVCGFYRGVTEFFRMRQSLGLPRNVVIQPMLFSESPGEAPYSPSSPGASPSDYLPAIPWW